MSDETDRSQLESLRAQLAQVRRTRAQLWDDIARSDRTLKELGRTADSKDPKQVAAQQQHEKLMITAPSARDSERLARSALADALARWLPQQPGDELRRLATSYPIVLLPVRLETRFAGDALKVRVYPDEIFADSHEAPLTDAERNAGREFWNAAWDPAGQPEAWRRFRSHYPEPRAEFIRATLTPTNLQSRPAGTPVFPDADSRSHGWTRATEAWLLPERWIVVAYRDGDEVHRAVSGVVSEPLALTLTPQPDAPLAEQPGAPALDTDVAWTVDFARAEAVGMAVRIPLDEEDRRRGFDRLVVVGVKASLAPNDASVRLSELFQSHRYTHGFALVPQGTATHNTAAGSAGYTPPAPSADPSPPPTAVPIESGSDGAAFARALGIPADSIVAVTGALRGEQANAAAMNEALWPATWGYFLEQMMSPVFSPNAIAAARRYFVDHVRGRGSIPAFRIGATPYGVLPVSSLARWRVRPKAGIVEQSLPGGLRTLHNVWAARADVVPRVNRTADPDGDLLAVLAMDASTREVRARQVLGQATQSSLIELLGLSFHQWALEQQALAGATMARIGHPEWNPRIATQVFADAANLFSADLVAPGTPSETDSLSWNYLEWIRSASLADLDAERLPADVSRPPALLYLMLRHSALMEYAGAAFDLLTAHDKVVPDQRREPEFVDVADGAPVLTARRRFDQTIPVLTGERALRDYLAPGRSGPTVDRFLEALRKLEPLPTAELQRLFTETLDLCSHRLDAWISSLASQRLEELRSMHATGSYLGAFGWVEELRPSPPGRATTVDGGKATIQPNSGGYIHAPSMTAAAAAAVLRNAHLTRSGAERAQYTVDLSSRRVRIACDLLEGVREGQRLGALLGYRLERRLHKLQLDRYIEPLRQTYPMPGGTVIDGLGLRKSWRMSLIPIVELGLSGEDLTGMTTALGELDEVVDAVADLLSAESVYQLMKGNTAAGGATLDALAAGVIPPQPEIVQTPRSGTSLTHRVAIVFGGDPLPLAPGWPSASPRAAAAPQLDAWVGSLLGDPMTIRCRVVTDATTAVTVSLADLQLRPLDFLALAHSSASDPSDTELDRRIAEVAAERLGQTRFRIVHEPDPAWDRRQARSFPEILELAQTIQTLLGGARALASLDLTPPEAPDRGAPLGAEILGLALTARQQLLDGRRRLSEALAAVRTAPSTPPLLSLRIELRNCALFGISGAYPAVESVAETLVAQAHAVMRELDQRALAAAVPPNGADASTQAAAATALMRAVFGRHFVSLPPFRPAAEELSRALDTGGTWIGDPSAPRRWLQQIERVRAPLGRWRKLRLYAEALGAPPLQLTVAQLPHTVGARWIALPLDENEPVPRSGQLSIVLNQAAPIAGGRPWVGLLLDEWTEVIPAETQQTAVAVHYDDPGAEAAQSILIAVPPDDSKVWDLETLLATVHETIDLVKLRGVDSELLGELGQLLPAIFLPANAPGDTLSVDLNPHLVAEITSTEGV